MVVAPCSGVRWDDRHARTLGRLAPDFRNETDDVVTQFLLPRNPECAHWGGSRLTAPLSRAPLTARPLQRVVGRRREVCGHSACHRTDPRIGRDPQRFLEPYAGRFVEELVSYCERKHPSREPAGRGPQLRRPKPPKP